MSIKAFQTPTHDIKAVACGIPTPVETPLPITQEIWTYTKMVEGYLAIPSVSTTPFKPF